MLEILLPVILTLGLVFIANLDTIFDTGSNDYTTSSSEAAATSQIIMCTGSISLARTNIGALRTNMSTFYSSGQSVIGLFLLISYMKFVSMTTTTMVIEKETRIREVMKIMGLSNFTLLCSWCLTTALLATPLAFIIAAELLIFLKASHSHEHSWESVCSPSSTSRQHLHVERTPRLPNTKCQSHGIRERRTIRVATSNPCTSKPTPASHSRASAAQRATVARGKHAILDHPLHPTAHPSSILTDTNH